MRAIRNLESERRYYLDFVAIDGKKIIFSKY